MGITAQNVNQILGGEFLPCHHCGRLVYYAPRVEEETAEVSKGGL
jgi:predicted  nucleic acid-binding Zn-ribbon protein